MPPGWMPGAVAPFAPPLHATGLTTSSPENYLSESPFWINSEENVVKVRQNWVEKVKKILCNKSLIFLKEHIVVWKS